MSKSRTSFPEDQGVITPAESKDKNKFDLIIKSFTRSAGFTGVDWRWITRCFLFEKARNFRRVWRSSILVMLEILWNNLRKFSVITRINSDLFLVGLIKKSESGNKVFDRFRNRIIFPIFNKNEVIAFGGRTIVDDNNTPKYLNSPETDLFVKSKELTDILMRKDTSQANL